MKKLFIIAGHGNGDSGAVGNGYKESERVRALAAKIKEFGNDMVLLSDFSLNAYKSDIISKGVIPSDCNVLELHLDSSDNLTAQGGHVIINAKFNADKYDQALAKMISDIFPGRSQKIVKRNDIANINRAAQKGYNYRILECCFISNKQDITKFNESIDVLAKEILKCFDFQLKPHNNKPLVSDKKSVNQIAREVIAGKWGNGNTRKINLLNAGYDYDSVQAEVNRLSGKANAKPLSTAKSEQEIAREVISGKWGNGAQRKESLEKAAYNYSAIQKLVNKLIK